MGGMWQSGIGVFEWKFVQPVLIVERQNHSFGGKIYFGSSSSSLSKRELRRGHSIMPAAVTREGCVLGWGVP